MYGIIALMDAYRTSARFARDEYYRRKREKIALPPMPRLYDE